MITKKAAKARMAIKDNVCVEVYGADGKLKSKIEAPNLIVSAGKACAASRWGGSGGEAAQTFIAVGTGTNAAVAGDTTLQTEIADSGMVRAAGAASRSTTTVTNDTGELTKTFAVTGPKEVTEAAILNAAADGALGSRCVFAAQSVVDGDSLVITWKHDFS